MGGPHISTRRTLLLPPKRLGVARPAEAPTTRRQNGSEAQLADAVFVLLLQQKGISCSSATARARQARPGACTVRGCHRHIEIGLSFMSKSSFVKGADEPAS